jgi:putative ABC transport system ATP-binding protein
MWQGTGDPRPEVAFVLQVYGLIPILSAQENVSVALRARGIDPREADERAEAALARFHIADLADRQVEELSGGQMQRVACARGLVVGAEILLADEPTSELDEANRTLVLGELRQEALRGAIVVVATHDPAVADACDRHYVLDDGQLTDHVAAVDLSAWGREQPEMQPVVAPQAAVPVGAPRPPQVELAETMSAEGGAPAEEESDDDTIFRRPRSRPE